MNNIITNSIRNKRHVRILTKLPSHEKYDGIIFRDNKNLIGINSFLDFQYNGVSFFPKKIIKEIRDNEIKILANEIIRFNGEIKKCKKLKWINDVNNFQELISKIQEHHIWPGIMMLEGKYKTAFYLGPITRVHKNHFGLYCYTSKGKWEAEFKLKYNKIFKIFFYDTYTTDFNKYMKAYNPFTKANST